MRISRLTTIERDNLSPSPIGGYLIYNIDTDNYQVYSETLPGWENITISQSIEGKKVSAISMYATNNNIPLNELVLTGTLSAKQEVDKVIYSDLYAVIGDLYGVPLDSNNFVLPPIVGLTPKGGTAANYSQSGGSDTLTEGQLPVVDATGTIQISTNPPNIAVVDDSFFANTDSFIANGSQGTTISVAGVNVNFGANQPHEHPYQNFIFTICFQEVGVNQVAPTPNLQQVTDAGNTTTNSISIGTTLNFSNGSFIEDDGDLSLISDGAVRLRTNNNGFQKYIELTPVNPLIDNHTIVFKDQSGTVAFMNDIVGFIKQEKYTEQSGNVIAGTELNTFYYYSFNGLGELTLPTAVGNTSTYQVKNATNVNITVVFTGLETADGNSVITLLPFQSLTFISNNTNYDIN